jgi:hypothetical protein
LHEPARYVAGASVHVVPSRQEAWSQSAVMALGLGVPVAGTAVDGLAATLGNGRGVLVAPDDPHALACARPLTSLPLTSLPSSARSPAPGGAGLVVAAGQPDEHQVPGGPSGQGGHRAHALAEDQVWADGGRAHAR